MKEKINSIQLASIFTLLIFSSSIGISLYTTIKIASIDSYISVFLGGLLGIIPLLLVLYIFNYDIDKPIYEKNKTIFGHFLGNIINIIILLLYLIVAATILFNTSNFIVSQYLSDTPLILIMIILMLIILYTINKGIETISRTSAIFVIITLFFFLFGICGTLSEIKIENLKPFLEFGIEKPLIGSFVNMLMSTAPIYTILIIPKNNLCDNKKTAKSIADTLEIKNVIANVTPNEKSNIIKKLKDKGKIVMMCGDGINDSPALALSDIGVSVNSGTDIARDSSDVILTKNDLTSIMNLINISKKTIRNIKQNLFWAFFYNSLMIPIAMGVLSGIGININPMIASLAMVLSSFTVILNALRLKKIKM